MWGICIWIDVDEEIVESVENEVNGDGLCGATKICKIISNNIVIITIIIVITKIKE